MTTTALVWRTPERIPPFLRIGEACRLLWNDVDAVSATLRVPTEKKRKASRRVVPVPAELTAALLLYRHEGEAHVRGVHERARGRTPQCRIRRPFEMTPGRAWARLRRLMQDAGIEAARAHPHVFRHTYAVRAVRAGMPPIWGPRRSPPDFGGSPGWPACWVIRPPDRHDGLLPPPGVRRPAVYRTHEGPPD